MSEQQNMSSASSPTQPATAPKPATKNAWMGPMDTKEEAEKVLRDVVNTFYFLGLLQGAIAYFFIGVSAAFDGVLYIVFAFLLSKYKKGWLAIVLLVLAGISLVVTFEAKATGGPGGTNIFLAAIILWAAVRGVQATHKLKQFSGSTLAKEDTPKA